MTAIENYKDTHRSYWLPVEDPSATSVLGSHCSIKDGGRLWIQLDWSYWWIDGTENNYFHVRCKFDPKHDGHNSPAKNDPDMRRVYRVRCWYANRKYRGWPVESVGIGRKDNKLHWIVRTAKPGTK